MWGRTVCNFVHKTAFCCLLLYTVVSGNPTGCTYFSSEFRYECTARSWVLPLTLSAFSNTPQVLHLVEVNGELPSAAPLGPTFSGFDAINTGTFNLHIDPSLVVVCVSGGSLIMSPGTFSGMSYIKEMKFVGCKILNVPDLVFSDFGPLNVFGFEGGSISGMGFDAFKNLSVQPMTDVKIPLGKFYVKNSKIENGQFPNGVFYNLREIRHVVLDQADLSFIQQDIFLVSTKIQTLSLSHNNFSSLNSKMISNLPFLHHVQLRGNTWECTCTDLNFFEYMDANNITYVGDILCSDATSGSGVKASDFYSQNCAKTDPCGIIKAIVIGDHCLPIIQLVNLIVLVFCFILLCISLGLLVNTKKKMVLSRDAKLMRALGLLKPNPNKNEKLPVKKDMPEVSDC